MADSKQGSILESSILAICGGIAINALTIAAAPYSAIMIVSGILGVGYYFYTHSKFDRLFKNLNLGINNAYPILKKTDKTDISTIYTFTLPAGISTEDVERNKEKIQQFLGHEIEIKYTFKAMQIEVFDNDVAVKYDYEPVRQSGNINILVGRTRQGKDIICDLSKGEPHMLIAGETGSGKSTTLRSIITNLILTSNVNLHLIDLKMGAEFQIFANCKNVVSFCKNRHEAEKTLNAINSEIDRRYNLFVDNNCVDIKEYNRKFPKLSYEVIIIDEFADLQFEKGCISILEEISAKARACGIHLIISTQRPDAKVLNGRIKANVTTILGLKTMNETNSRIIIDTEGLEKLRGSGHGIFKRGNIKEEVQSPYLSTERARELIKHTYIDKRKNIVKFNQQAGDLLC